MNSSRHTVKQSYLLLGCYVNLYLYILKARLKKQYWFDCQCIPCTENWPLMHEMSDDTLNFRCFNCDGAVPFSTHATNPLLRCVCGTPVEVLKVK